MEFFVVPAASLKKKEKPKILIYKHGPDLLLVPHEWEVTRWAQEMVHVCLNISVTLTEISVLFPLFFPQILSCNNKKLVMAGLKKKSSVKLLILNEICI